MSDTPDGAVSFAALDQMANENKGAFGEALAGIWLKDHLKQHPEFIFGEEIPEDDPRMWFSHVGSVDQINYGKVGSEGVEKVSWEPDYSFFLTLPDQDLKRRVLVEAKTGRSTLVRAQREVMELTAQDPETVVYLCEVDLEGAAAEVDYTRIEPEE
jgi:hypothetical protein